MKLKEIKSQFIVESVDVSPEKALEWEEESKNIKPIPIDEHIKEVEQMLAEMEDNDGTDDTEIL